jgi:hypothetical protein
MKLMRAILSRINLPHFILAIFASVSFFLSNTFPALAISSYSNNPKGGTTQLLDIQRRTDKVAESPPLNLKQVEKAQAGKGLNEVQGDADINKMKRPENSQDAVSVEEEVAGFLKKVTGN